MLEQQSPAHQAQAESFWRQAIAHHEAGQLREAAVAYRGFLAIWPEHVGALCNLGMLSCRMGAAEQALPILQQATRLAPDLVEAHANMGQALKQLGRMEEALASYRQAASLQDDNPWCHFNLAVVLHQLGRRDEALASYQDALRFGANLSPVHNNLGKLLREMGKPEAAIESYRRACELSPGYVEAQFNLGQALAEAGRTDEAASVLADASDLRPAEPRLCNELGSELLRLGRPKAAVAAFQRLAELKPDSWEAHCNLGSAFGRLGDQAEAVASFERALQLRPDSAEVLCNHGVSLKNLGRHGEAIASLRRAVELNPAFVDAANNLGLILKDVGLLEEALACFRRVLELRPDHHEAHSNLLFTLNLLPGHAPADMLEQARAYGTRVAAGVEPYQTWKVQALPDKCLRVGLVSGDLRGHPVGFFLEGVLSALDPTRLELYAYATHHVEDGLTQRIRPRFAQWRMVMGMSDAALVRCIHDDGIDILIDLAGHTGYNRLPTFALKPAPVQATWLGYLATTGLEAMDYVLADPLALPPGEEDQFVETPWRLPETYISLSPPDLMIEPGPTPALTQGHVTFGCFNNLTKMNDQVVACWARLLQAVPDSQLYLKSKPLAAADIREDVVQRFARHGIEAGRLLLEGQYDSREAHFRAHHRVDIALDPFPYPGITTTVEALWMGVPVLSMRGDRFMSHQGETILASAGLTDWVALDEEDYVAKAKAFAGDVAALAELHGQLRGKLLGSPVCDVPRFAGHFESALRGMWQHWCLDENSRADAR